VDAASNREVSPTGFPAGFHEDNFLLKI